MMINLPLGSMHFYFINSLCNRWSPIKDYVHYIPESIDSVLSICFYDTFEQSEEESLRVCDCNSAFLIGAGFGLELFVVIFVEEAEGVWHAYGVALMKSLVVLAEMFGAHAHLLILLLSSWWTTQTVNIYKESVRPQDEPIKVL